MKRLLLAVIFTLIAVSSFAQYQPGLEGVEVGSYLPSNDGLSVRIDNAFYTTDTLEDLYNGKYEQFNYSAYIRGFYSFGEVFGATYSPNVSIPIVYGNVNADTFEFDDYDIGNIYVEPVALTWDVDNIKFMVAGGFYIPVSDEDNPVTGDDYWTGVVKAGGTYYIGETNPYFVSGLVAYEINGESNSYDMEFGDNVSFEYGLGKYLTENLSVGVAGYMQWQISDSEGTQFNPWEFANDAEVYAAGPAVSYNIDSLGVSLQAKSLFEFGAKDTTEGNLTVLTINKSF